MGRNLGRNKIHSYVSVAWKALVLFFPLVGSWLVWKMNNGDKVNIGDGRWVGSGDGFRLPRELITELQTQGIYLYAEPSCRPSCYFNMQQGWIFEEDLRLSKLEAESWNGFVGQLKKNHI